MVSAVEAAQAAFSPSISEKIIRDLAEFKSALQREPDTLTQQCAATCQRFIDVLNTHRDPVHVVVACKAVICELAIDHVTKERLNDDAVLGRDGYTYNRTTILKSPEPNFFVSAINHPLRHLLQWSSSFTYEGEEDEAELAAFARSLDTLTTSAKACFDDVHRRTDEHAQSAHARLDAMTENLLDQQQDLSTMVQRLAGEMDTHLATEVHEHSVRIAELSKKVVEVGKEISIAQHQDNQLRLAIEQTKQAKRDRERGWVQDLVKAVAVIGACWFAHWALTEAFAAMGSAAKVGSLPAKGGGMLNVKAPIPYK